MSCFEGAEAMDLEKGEVFSEDPKKGNLSPSCSICLDLVLQRGGRSTARLLCGHEFHLDCIGSAFNAKGTMQCPNCRKVEEGRWLYANGKCLSADFDLDSLVTEDFYDLNYPELPLGLHWCPFRGITQLASLFGEGESLLNSYHESFANSTFGDNLTASSSSHLCPYLAYHGFPHSVHGAAPYSSAAGSLSENSTFARGQPSTEVPSSHSFASTEPQNRNWQQQQHSLSFSLMGSSREQSAAQFGSRVSRSDAGGQQRLGSLVHRHSINGSGPRTASNLVTSSTHAHTRGRSGSYIYHHSPPSSSLRTAPAPPVRRSRPPRGGFTLFSSSLAPAPPPSDASGFYGLAAVSGTSSRAPQESETMAARNHFDRFYGGGLTPPLPWVPLEGESHWWVPFNPTQPPQPGGSFLQRRANATERTAQRRAENGYHRMPVALPSRMSPPSSYM